MKYFQIVYKITLLVIGVSVIGACGHPTQLPKLFGVESDAGYINDTNFVEIVKASEIADNGIIHDAEVSGNLKIVNECPNGVCSFASATCLTSFEPELTGYKSLCSFRCWIDPESNTEYVFYFFNNDERQDLDGDCASVFTNGATCCGNAMDMGEGSFLYYCVPPDGCCPEPYPIRCGSDCCSQEEECNQTTKICESKCKPPAPLYCKDECCPNNYYCECKDWGGFCLPEGAEMCDCEDKSWCEPLQECIADESCYEELISQGKPPCKPLGAEDCPETEGCYCNPGYICTHESPACCASDEPVACGDYCCPDKNECLTDIQDCLAPGWDYCEAWGTKCGVGLACKQVEPGCKNDDEEECEYGGVICGATEDCVGEGKGKDGCCPTNNPIACDGYCCPTGTHCELGCGGCVENGKKCCPDGLTECYDAKICWAGGSGCIDSIEQDCGSYMCDPNYVCSSGPQKCCPALTPQTCGDQCCLSFPAESCVSGICIPSGGEYCPGAPGGYCPIGNSCGDDWTQLCCCGATCAPPSGICCDSGTPPHCGAGLQCCNGGCSPAGTKCCWGAGEHCPIGNSCCGGGIIFSGPPGCYPSEGYYCCSFGNSNGYCLKEKKWCYSGSATGNKLKCCPNVYPNVDGCVDPYPLFPVQQYP